MRRNVSRDPCFAEEEPAISLPSLVLPYRILDVWLGTLSLRIKDYISQPPLQSCDPVTKSQPIESEQQC